MPLLTLQETKIGMQDDLQKGIIDEITKGDYLFSNIPFDNIANPVAGGSGWTVSYVKLKDEAKTDFRDINGKYTDTIATKKKYSADVKIYGGSIVVDRALRDQGGVENEITFQVNQLIKAIKKGFSYNLINGSVAVDGRQFDGLDALLRSSSTDIQAHTTAFDISTYANMKTNALEFISILDNFLSELNEKPSAILGNKLMINKIKAICKILGINTMSQNQIGETIDTYNGIALITLGEYNDGTATKETIPFATNGTSSLYAVRFGQDALYVASPSSGKVIDVILPDFNQASEQVRGLVELRGVPVLKDSKSCGVLRNIKIK